MLGKIKRNTVADAVIEQIRHLIMGGSLRKGDKLPPEQELAHMLGVGRSSVREALKGLTAAGVVTRTPEGTYITSNGECLVEPLRYRVILEGMTLLELCEARRVFETEFASLAAARGTEDDISAISREVERMEKALDTNVAAFIEADVQFHLHVARAAKNRILFELFRAVRTLLTEAQETVVRDSPGIKSRSLEYHRNILLYIRARDREGARKVMMEHLKDVESSFATVFAEPGLTPPGT